MNRNGIAVLFIVLFAIAGILPLIQQGFRPIKLAGLQGAFDGGEMPIFSLTDYIKGDFQKKTDFYLQYNTAFNGNLVRLRNQIDYDLFGNINTILTLGKENYIFDPNSVSVVCSLLRSQDIPLLVIVPPNKANYFSEYLFPYVETGDITNKKLVKDIIESNHETLIDFDNYFLDLKSKSKYPLMPKYGAHWSTYGAAIAGDSVLQAISKILNQQSCKFIFSSTEIAKKPRYTDDDYLPSLNLMRKWESPPFAYPELQFSDGYKPKALIISDSYIWNWYDLGLMKNAFDGKSVLLYYFKTIYDPERNKVGALSENLSIKQLTDFDIVIVLNSDAGLPDFGYGFFQKTSKLIENE